MNERMNKLHEFLNKIYVPADLRENHKELIRHLSCVEYRAVDIFDQGQMYVKALVIKTKGRGLYETYQGYDICRIDVGHVSNTMVDVAIYEPGSSLANPKRVNRGNIKINLPM